MPPWSSFFTFCLVTFSSTKYPAHTENHLQQWSLVQLVLQHTMVSCTGCSPVRLGQPLFSAASNIGHLISWAPVPSWTLKVNVFTFNLGISAASGELDPFGCQASDCSATLLSLRDDAKEKKRLNEISCAISKPKEKKQPKRHIQ